MTEHFNYGENNPLYKKEGYSKRAVHIWVRRRKPEPSLCERCGSCPPKDLANISGKYLRDNSDWEYLCRKCHMDSDGRNSQLIESGKSRKIPDVICAYCGVSFHRKSKMKGAIFCSRKCYFSAGGRYHKNKKAGSV